MLPCPRPARVVAACPRRLPMLSHAPCGVLQLYVELSRWLLLQFVYGMV